MANNSDCVSSTGCSNLSLNYQNIRLLLWWRWIMSACVAAGGAGCCQRNFYWGSEYPRNKEKKSLGTYPDVAPYQHVPGLVFAFVLSVELDGFEEGLHFTRLLLQEVWRRGGRDGEITNTHTHTHTHTHRWMLRHRSTACSLYSKPGCERNTLSTRSAAQSEDVSALTRVCCHGNCRKWFTWCHAT